MHHYRGKLLDGDRIQLDPANVFIQFRNANGGAESGWYGYLLIASDRDVEAGNTYTLRLEDGRSGRLQVEEFTPDDSGKLRAVFVGDGPLS